MQQNLYPFVFQQRLPGSDLFFDELSNEYGLFLNRRFAFQLCQRKVVPERLQQRCVSLNRFQKFARYVRIMPRCRSESRHNLGSMSGRFEFMGDIGDEILAHRLPCAGFP
jgi:hypothetical protein